MSRFFSYLFSVSDDLKTDTMNLFDIIKFCADYPALVIAVLLGIGLWSMVIMVALTGGRANNAKKD